MHPAFKEFQKTQIGRLKARALSQISGTNEEFPSERETISGIMDAWLQNSEWGRFLFHIIYCTRCEAVTAVEKISVKQVRRCLDLLGRYKPIWRLVVEGSIPDDNRALSFVILGHNKPDDQPGYYVAMFDTDDYQQMDYLSIVPDRAHGARIDMLGKKGWKNISPKSAASTPEIATLLQGIWQFLTRPQKQMVPASQLKFDNRWEAPHDENFFSLVLAAYRGEVTVCKARVPIDLVKPHDLNFLASVTEGELHTVNRHLDGGQPESMVVYWNGSNFVMSDDYFVFAVCRKFEISEVNVAIIGDFPASLVQLETRGGAELLPDFLALGDDNTETSEEFRNWEITTRLRRRNGEVVPSTLIATWLVLADILGSKHVKEKDVHDFLRKHPEAISIYANSVESEVSLGGQYRIDLIVRESGLGSQVTLIELESPKHGLLTSQGRPRYEVTHAMQQARDWLRWLREHPNHSLAMELQGLRPNCLVVMGRSKDLSDSDLAILRGLNEESFVQVITYDELLSRFRDVILRRCDERRM